MLVLTENEEALTLSFVFAHEGGKGTGKKRSSAGLGDRGWICLPTWTDMEGRAAKKRGRGSREPVQVACA